MEEIFVLILQFVIELLLNVFSIFPLDWSTSEHETATSNQLWVKNACLFVVAGCIAWMSTFVFPQSLISVSGLRILNVLMAPIVSAYASQAITRRRSVNNPDLNPRHHFWQAFWFTLGLVLVRFAYVTR